MNFQNKIDPELLQFLENAPAFPEELSIEEFLRNLKKKELQLLIKLIQQLKL